MKLKICGMKYADNIREVAKLSPDFMGFIFYPYSKRFVGYNFVMPEITFSIKKVGVFVNDSIENILNKVKKYKLDFVQLHGNESVEFCKRTGEKVKIIKAFGIDEQFNFSALNEYENCCEYFLLDTKTKEYGGSGKSFDKNFLKHYKSQKPFFLSGGIDLEEVSILNTSNLFAIDVNSKFEISPGVKDINKLSLLIMNMQITNKDRTIRNS
ncbi:MAG: phosphoribosylanthranilate isomerase [Bacteroidota bacterium]